VLPIAERDAGLISLTGGTFRRLTADNADIADKKKIIFTFREPERDFISAICVICG
jgi:hypothetical protein